MVAPMVGVLLSQAAPNSRADLIPITFAPGGPTVQGLAGTLNYDATTGHFQASAPAATLNASYLPRGFALISNGTVSIDLFVDQNGNLVSGGTGVTLTGSVTINGKLISGLTPSDPLLQGTIRAFGSDPAGPPTRSMDLIYLVAGGELTTPGTSNNPSLGAFPVGSPGGALLSVENVTSGILGNFSQSFSSTSMKPLIGTIIVPEPGAWALGLFATVGFVGFGWLRSRGPRSGPGIKVSA
jgi:hypothetical protein